MVGFGDVGFGDGGFQWWLDFKDGDSVVVGLGFGGGFWWWVSVMDFSDGFQ